jgi:PAS domain S-box-containing protein
MNTDTRNNLNKPKTGLGVLLLIIFSQILLLVFLAIGWVLLREIFNLSVLATHIGIGVLALIWMLATSYIIFRKIILPLHVINSHIESIMNNNYKYRTDYKLTGAFATIGNKLNSLSDRLGEFIAHSQAETNVIASESNRLRHVLNSIKDGVFALDKGNQIILFNRAASKLTGYEIEEAAGKPVNHIVPLKRGAGQLVLFDWLKKNEGMARAEKEWEALSLQTSSGEILSVDVFALYLGEDPNGIRTLVTFNDRTAAQEIEDMKVDFVALAAHELRTPVTIINGYLEILSNELSMKADPGQDDLLRRLRVSVSQLSGFINNILNVSRIEHGSLNFSLEKTDWKKFLSDTCQILYEKAKLQEKTLELYVEENLPNVAVDTTSITEVIINLVDNAIKYSPIGSTINIKARKTSQGVETQIIDTGIGIPPNNLDKLFTKFYRSHRTKQSHYGTGLGLYVKRHH